MKKKISIDIKSVVINIVIYYFMKIVKTRAFKDRLKGHKDTIISLNSPHGHAGGMLFSASKDG
jgi:hypothetical protein